MRIGFDESEKTWSEYDTYVRRRASRAQLKRVLETGGGANRTLPTDCGKDKGLGLCP
jgi:hypothetical protein